METLIDINLYLLRKFLVADKVDHSEETIMQALDLTDEIQFEHEFKTHYKGLYNYAFTLLNDGDLAEEMVQNVFVKLWERRDNIQIKESLDAYLYRAVKNECLSHFKHEKVKSEHQAHTIHQERHKQYQDGSQKIIFSELEDKLNSAIDALPSQCRLIFQMSRFEDLKYRDIADKLGLSIKTIENQMGKALRTLRLQLIEYLPLILIILLNCR